MREFKSGTVVAVEGKQYVVGPRGHLWARCWSCRRLVKRTGWTRGLHWCDPEHGR
jgi:hypothetical protein